MLVPIKQSKHPSNKALKGYYMNLAIWDIESSSASTDFGSIIEIGGIAMCLVTLLRLAYMARLI